MHYDDCLVIFIFEFTFLTRVVGTTLLCRAVMKLPFLASLADEVRQEIHQPFYQ
jgi:hypothetical protein